MSKYKQLLKDLNLIDDDENDVVTNLLKVPKKDKPTNTPRTHVNEQNFIHQVDTLYLPHDGPYKYSLVAVDLATHHMDAQPLKTKSSEEALKALQQMYKRKYLNKPHTIEVDDGTEFKDQFKAHFKDIELRVKKSGRHRAQAVVEWMNSILSDTLNRFMLNKSIQKNREIGEWVENLPIVVKAINSLFSRNAFEIDAEKNPPRCKGDSCNLLEVGQKVRIQLDNPQEFTNGKRLHGKFRKGDIRFENRIRTITRLYIRPGQPPTYKVDDIDVAYTKNQLQLVTENEKAPKADEDGLQEVDKIIGKKKINNKIHYRILWSDGEKSYEPRTGLIGFIHDIIKDYE